MGFGEKKWGFYSKMRDFMVKKIKMVSFMGK
jgi:hypothetical protein